MSEERRGFTYSTETYDVLSHPRRHRILFELTQQATPISLDSLAEAITRTEGPDVDGIQGVPTDADAVATSLHHQHIPKLAASGWVEYNAEEGTIQYQSHVDQIRADLRDVSDELASIRAALDDETMGSFAHEGDRRPPPPDEHVTLTRALELGYFEVPRRATLTDIADELGISDVEASERLRREIVSVLRERP